ncbi:replication-relaxation family protein [Rummeliibacillus pycnus]|uniref:replication-relaxation family protein n=1 Tax=Rummeliibacillus pycnus TaxID=101070 RepID=UPI0037C8C786
MQDKIILKKNARLRLELTKSDLQLLAFLEQQRMLTIQQSYTYAKKFCYMNMTDYSFKNRIRKFEDYKLIRGYHYSEGFDGERFKYICIGSKGIDLLIEQNLLDSTYNKSKIYKFDKKKNIIHFLMTQQVVINLLTQLDGKIILYTDSNKGKYLLFYDEHVSSYSPAVLQYTEWIRKEKNLHRQNNGSYHAKIAKYMTPNNRTTEINGTTMTIVKPDWIVKIKGENETRDAFINIELDMGTEPIETIIEKVFKYAIQAEKNPYELHIMNIVIADNSFSNRSRLSDGIRRGENIAKQLVSDPQVVNRIKESGLKIKISPLKYNNEAVYTALQKYS